MRLSRQIQKLASTSKATQRSPAFVVASRHASTSTSTSTSTSSSVPQEQASSFTPDQPPHLSTSESLYTSIPKPQDQGFFNPSRPSFLNSTTPNEPVRASQRETDIYAELQQLINQPSSYRTEIGSAKIWQKYISLSPAFRRSLPVKFLEKVFKYVIPNRKHLKELSSIPAYDNKDLVTEGGLIKGKILREKLKHHSSLGIKWERRLRTIASDIMSSSTSSKVDPQIFINGLSKLAIVGDKSGCESIIKEVLFRYEDKLSFNQLRTMYSHGLRSISKWLKIHSYRLSSSPTNNGSVKKNQDKQIELYEVGESTKRLIRSMQQKKISPNSTTAENLLNISRLITSHSSSSSSSSRSESSTKLTNSFNELTELILINGYSLDLQNLSFGITPDDQNRISQLKPSVKLSVIDYFGRRGELYKMVAAFETLFPGDLDRLPTAASSAEDAMSKQEEEEDIPTLSRLIAAEQKERAERGWFGQRSVEDVQADHGTSSASAESSNPHPSRDYNDYLPPIPLPYDILPPTSLSPSSSLHTSVITNLKQAESSPTNQHGIDGEGAVVSSVLSMLSKAWLSKIKVSPNDTVYKDISIHVLRLALRAAHVEQARYLYALKEGNLVGGNENGVGPELRIEGNWFKAVWRTVRWTRSSSRRGIKFSKIILKELENVKIRLEQERIILIALLTGTNEQGEFIINESSSSEGLISESTIDALLKMIKGIERLEIELVEIEENIQSNLITTVERKTRSNSARVIKLEERRQELLAMPSRGSKRGISDRLLNSKAESLVGDRSRGEHSGRNWDGPVDGTAVIA